MSFSIVAALGKKGEIGTKGKLPWHIPEDLKRFKELTVGHSVIMGRKTFESIMESLGKPLPERKNIVITRNEKYVAPEGCIVVNSLEEALKATNYEMEVFIIGGAEIFRQALPLVNRMYITAIDQEFPADTFFPEINPSEWQITGITSGRRREGEPISFSYFVYDRITRTDD